MEDDELAGPSLPSIERIELERVPRQLWKQTLAPYHRSLRTVVVRQVSDSALREIAWQVAEELDREESTRTISLQREQAAGRRHGAPLPMPGADHGAVRRTVQINTRLRADDHARLRRAADAVGLRPTTLARALVLNGVAMILRDHPDRGAES